MSKLDDLYKQQRTARYGIDRLETEPAKRTIDLTQSPVTPSRHDERFRESIRQKYGMTQLAVEGIATRKETTVAEFVEEHDRQSMRGVKLVATAKDSKGRRLWLTVSK